MEVVSAKKLRRSFAAADAVKEIDFAIGEGECYGFLGPNGAGKTTTVRMIHGLLPRTGGELRVFGMDMRRSAAAIKEKIGAVSQDNTLDRDLTVRQNLLTHARFFGIPPREAALRAAELISFLQLEGKAGEKLQNLSGGMQRRLAIARALINNPRLLILDEPTTGLDPQARHLIWRRLDLLKQQKITMVLTTHYMEEAERLCDRVAIVNGGRILMEGPPRELVRREIGTEVIEIHVEEGRQEEALEHVRGLCENTDIRGGAIHVYNEACHALLPELLKIEHRFIIHRKATLEDLFLKLAGRTLAD